MLVSMVGFNHDIHDMVQMAKCSKAVTALLLSSKNILLDDTHTDWFLRSSRQGWRQ
jgi:hypothetical protein